MKWTVGDANMLTGWNATLAVDAPGTCVRRFGFLPLSGDSVDYGLAAINWLLS